MSVFVSAGHGPRPGRPFDPGATWEGFTEHAEALVWRDAIAHAGELLGLPCVVVPAVSLTERVEFINEVCAKVGPSIAIEMHFNAAAGPGPRGCETLYAPNSSRGQVFAEIVQSELRELFPPDRGAKEAWYR